MRDPTGRLRLRCSAAIMACALVSICAWLLWPGDPPTAGPGHEGVDSGPGSASFESARSAVALPPARVQLERAAGALKFVACSVGGEPVSGCFVLAPAAAERRRWLTRDDALGQTDATGVLELVEAEVDPGAECLAWRPGFHTAVFSRTSETVRTARLVPLLPTTIRAVDETGTPIPGVRFVLSRSPFALGELQDVREPIPNPSADMGEEAMHTTTTDEAGCAVVHLATGDYFVGVLHETMVPVDGVHEAARLSVPGGPYLCTMRGAVGFALSIRDPEAVVAARWWRPPQNDAMDPRCLAALDYCARALRARFPTATYTGVGVSQDGRPPHGVTERGDLLLRDGSVRRIDCDHARLDEVELRHVDLGGVDDRTGTCTVHVVDHRGSRVPGIGLALVAARSDRGAPSPRIESGVEARLPAGSYEVATVAPMRNITLEDATIEVEVGGRTEVEVRVREPMLPCRLAIDSELRGAGVNLTITVADVASGRRLAGLWVSGAPTSCTLWLPETLVRVNVTGPVVRPAEVQHLVGADPSSRRIAIVLQGRGHRPGSDRR